MICILFNQGVVIVCYRLANLNKIQELFLVYLQSGLNHYEKTGLLIAIVVKKAIKIICYCFLVMAILVNG